MADFLPGTDAGLLEFVNPFSTKITATPTAFGVTSSIATSLASKVSAYSSALTACTDPATRGQATVFAKDTAKAALIAYVRQVARQIQGTITVTDQQRQDLGLTVRNPATPIQPPTEPPVAEIESRIGTQVRLKLHDGTGNAKPAGVDGARVYSHIGTSAPTDLNGWEFEGQATRRFVDIEFPVDTPAGTLVWFTACWYTRRGETSPACSPISTPLAGGAITEAA